MNIFILDYDTKLAAKYHCDKHVVKMVLETAQIMSTVLWKLGHEGPYRETHKNHPCVIWAAETSSNFVYLADLGMYLGEEYTRRYGKVHKSSLVIEDIMNLGIYPPDGELTPFKQCMPDECKRDCAVDAYRHYYKTVKVPSMDVSYKDGQVPEFLS